MSRVTRASILSSIRFRFSPETQPVKEQAIDRILEQNLLLADSDSGLSFKDIRSLVDLTVGEPLSVFGDRELAESLGRLRTAGRVQRIDQKEERYALTESAAAEAYQRETEAQSRTSRIVAKLFETAPGEPRAYETSFLDALATIFSELGESYVQLIKGDANLNSVLSPRTLSRVTATIQRKYHLSDGRDFFKRLLRFFTDEDPDYNVVKWNMTQNYFVARILGLDQADRLLSDEVFECADFYLDTNVIINALEPEARHHRSFNTLSTACRKLDAKLSFCRISLDELRRVVDHRRSLLGNVGNQVPKELEDRVSGVFYRLYREYMKSHEIADFDEIFAKFYDARRILTEEIGASEFDSEWFEESSRDPHIQRCASEIKTHYAQLRGKRKGNASALHDSQMIEWVRKKRTERPKTFFVSLDTTFPDHIVADGSNADGSLFITLDALLQWMSPVALSLDDEAEMTSMFAEALRYRLLPIDNFLDISDFLMFAAIDWDAKELPAEDVEECIRHIKHVLPKLDLIHPKQREMLSREVNRFFANPTRKLNEELMALRTSLEDETRTASERESDLQQRLELQQKQFQDKIDALEKTVKDVQGQQEIDKQKREARFWLGLSILVFVAMEIVCYLLSVRFAEGQNIIQKVGSVWFLFVLAFALSILIGRLMLGRDRIKALGWQTTKFFGSE